MAKTVKATMPGMIDIQNSDLSVEVWEDDQKLGTLKLSKGSVDFSLGRKSRSVSWEQLRDFIFEKGWK